MWKTYSGAYLGELSGKPSLGTGLVRDLSDEETTRAQAGRAAVQAEGAVDSTERTCARVEWERSRTQAGMGRIMPSLRGPGTVWF